jgi:hypothetical protein
MIFFFNFSFSFCYDFFLIFFVNFFLILKWLRVYLCYFFLSFYKINMICGFVEVTQVLTVYGIGGFFLIEFGFFIIFFLYC